ncbi:hypothetical protein N0V93_001406 [Gnomoniopsis smithogilvyi]|uniref:Cytochrome P450 n=1 Tax=Gnomoniopsis smithogilvyi TaxID=1191159 RepID=A0A9W8Z5U7_9PEZI|nr:hypothetical protein N0V93_001406 [Gnomoniopsis smithogilvyi]
MFSILESYQRPVVLGALLLVGYFIYLSFFKPSPLPDLPILNARKGEWFPLWRATWRNTRDFKAACKLAQSQYRDQACLVPLLYPGTLVLLPSKLSQYVVDQPDSIISLQQANVELLQTDYTMDPHVMPKQGHINTKLIKTTLTNQAGNLVSDLAEEIELCLHETWGSNTTTFRDVCVYESLQHVIARVTNRIFVGLSLSRIPEIPKLGIAFAQHLPLVGTLLLIVPAMLRPVLSGLITLPIRNDERALDKILRPEVERRLRAYEDRANPEHKILEPEPNDFLQWSIKDAKESGNPFLLKLRTLTRRVLMLNFASITTSSLAITGAMFDLLSSNKAYIEELREEISTVLAEHGGNWNKKALSQMVKLDSTMRESQRLNSAVTMGLGRAVVAPGGITTPDGVHIPKGNYVVVPGYATLHNADLYPDPDEFKPFRFCEPSPAGEDDVLARARQQWATTSNEYLAFGHGRHACPGRMFASTEMKLLLAQIIMTYDFEMLESRPKNKWMGFNRMPDMSATISLRKRQNA